MKSKYIEERFPPYFEFGGNKDTGLVDVASINNDTIVSVSKEQAEYLIKDRDAILEMLIAVSQKLDEVAPDEFKKIWYGEI